MSNFNFLFNRPVARKIPDAKLHNLASIESRLVELKAEQITKIGQARINSLELRKKTEFKCAQTVVLEVVARIPAHLLAGKSEREEGIHAY